VRVAARISPGQSEHFVDELILTPHISSAYPSNLPLAQHVDRFISLNRSSRRMELSESLLGIQSSFDGAVVLLDDVVQVPHWSMPAAAAESPFLLNSWNSRGVDGCQIRVDDARLGCD
jgi:hypothetical protein